MMDQAAELRKLVEQEKTIPKEEAIVKEEKNNESKPRIITVTSGKGGVGKSNFVVNMAISLQQMGKKVLIFDADIGMGNDDILMGFLPKFNVYDIIFDNKTIEEVVIEGPFGVKLLPGGSGILKFEELTESQRENFIDKLSEFNHIDYVIIDTGAGVNRSVLGFITCCDELIVIITPEPTSFTDAYSLLKTVNHFKLKKFSKVVVNKTIDSKEGENAYNKFNGVVSRFLNIELQYLGNMSEDKKLVQAVRSQEPFLIRYPNSDVARDIKYIAKKILGLEADKNPKTIQELFKKMFNIFS